MSEQAAVRAGYFRLSELPYHSLLFVLPLIAAYELGVRYLHHVQPDAVASQIVAFAMMQKFFLWFGATGAMLPALAVVGILLASHIVRKDPWRPKPLVYAGMTVESVILAAPLLALGMALPQHLPMWGLTRSDTEWVVLAIGAGVYEELVFRLIGMTLLVMLFTDVLRIASKIAIPTAILLSAALFSLYHYWGHEGFEWRSMVFRTLAGIFFGVIFIFRGFGITVGAHASYDISIVLLRRFAIGG
ncbi:MAG TPA: CPBP family intramembrane metalloprotease [Tepidisphaeraceae bacterium]|nr:CPBP family intramembrane metalloprotease [Tepidisphaeraceae bacterium]